MSKDTITTLTIFIILSLFFQSISVYNIHDNEALKSFSILMLLIGVSSSFLIFISISEDFLLSNYISSLNISHKKKEIEQDIILNELEFELKYIKELIETENNNNKKLNSTFLDNTIIE